MDEVTTIEKQKKTFQIFQPRHPPYFSQSDNSECYFKTRQLYLALKSDGSVRAKLSPPLPLHPGRWRDPRALIDVRWPRNMEVIEERIEHIPGLPAEREGLHAGCNHPENASRSSTLQERVLVYFYHPNVGDYFTTSVIGGRAVPSNVPKSHSVYLEFESRFESGNLQSAVYVGDNEYHLRLNPDLYTARYSQWFYFRVKNMKKDIKYKFVIENFYKQSSLFNNGMRILMYSEVTARLQGIGWHRAGEDICYYETHNNHCSFDHVKLMNINDVATNPSFDGNASQKCQNHKTYSLEWSLRFPHAPDVVYFAACYPYTYTQLQSFLHNLRIDSGKNIFCQNQVLCRSLAGNDVPILTITEKGSEFTKCHRSHEQNGYSDVSSTTKKRCVILTARVHPGETQGSWMMQGVIEYLTSDDPDVEILRKNLIFEIIPMLNPDGVIVGNYRCSLSGCDLNRNYNSPYSDFFPEIAHTERIVDEAMQKYETIIYCDLHGHSRKQNIFVYGCKATDWRLRPVERILPAMLSKNAPDLFDYNECRYAVQANRTGTGRITMWKKGIRNSYTLEASFCGTNGDSEGQSYHFNTMDFKEMGRQFCETLLDFCDPEESKVKFIMEEIRANLLQRRSFPGNRLSADSSDESSGSDSSSSCHLPAKIAKNVPERSTPEIPLRSCTEIQRKKDSTDRIGVCPVCCNRACRKYRRNLSITRQPAMNNNKITSDGNGKNRNHQEREDRKSLVQGNGGYPKPSVCAKDPNVQETVQEKEEDPDCGPISSSVHMPDSQRNFHYGDVVPRKIRNPTRSAESNQFTSLKTHLHQRTGLLGSAHNRRCRSHLVHPIIATRRTNTFEAKPSQELSNLQPLTIIPLTTRKHRTPSKQQ